MREGEDRGRGEKRVRSVVGEDVRLGMRDKGEGREGGEGEGMGAWNGRKGRGRECSIEGKGEDGCVGEDKIFNKVKKN